MAPSKSEQKSNTVLEEALDIVFGAREKAYGHPRDDFARIANLWNAYCRNRAEDADVHNAVFEFQPYDVAYMMILLKMSRLTATPDHRDSIVDIAGYAATAARVVGIDE